MIFAAFLNSERTDLFYKHFNSCYWHWWPHFRFKLFVVNIIRVNFVKRNWKLKPIVQTKFKPPSLLNCLVHGSIMLFLIFNYLYSLSDFIKSFILSSVIPEYRCFLQKSKLLTVVVVNVKFFLNLFHLLEVFSKVWIFVVLKNFVQLMFL
jgi:hypothetical protein